MAGKLTDTALALLAYGCVAAGLEAPGAGDDLETWAKDHSKDEIMLHDYGVAVEAASRFDSTVMHSALHSVATFSEARDRPITRRSRDLEGDR